LPATIDSGKIRCAGETKRRHSIVTLDPGQLLELWRRVLLDGLRRDLPDLSARQMTLLLQVYLTPPPHTVRGLARELAISKPAVTRALDRLGELGLLRRKRDEADRRSVLIQRTVQGAVFLRDFGDGAVRLAGELEIAQ